MPKILQPASPSISQTVVRADWQCPTLLRISGSDNTLGKDNAPTEGHTVAAASHPASISSLIDVGPS